MSTDVHLSESKVLNQKLIPQILLEISGHLVSHQNTNNINYMNVFIAKVSFTPLKVPSPAVRQQKFSLKLCVTFVGISDPKGLQVRITFWIFI